MAIKLSQKTKKALSLAKLEAKRYNLVYIGTELVLLALVEERGSIAQKVFEEHDIDPRRLRQEVESNVLMGEHPLRPGQVIRAAPLVRRVVELAQEEANRVQAREVESEHLLLALIRERNGVAAEVIDNLGLDRTELRARVLEMMKAGKTPPESAGTAQSQYEAETSDNISHPIFESEEAISTNDVIYPPSEGHASSNLSEQGISVAAMLLRSVCEMYLALKAQGKSENELLEFLRSVLKGESQALIKQRD